ncbi:STN domain-containing protein [Rhodopseudomonas palustris]|uniref:STN domain-containing protein n=1 Tax=Rhodopseudomonas palustris (strain ATCC BAA-98 / CGA009) TaxID=258594 RepID=A0AAF0BLD7_RHOPA|nr:STN domain-containing protein [Rhodopseudomonas palustris]RJF60729.1 hypothetical protein D4Q71_23240 [Rhodopseudomonas palustris]WAB79018.1 STN domain-containing protein [Rhodopseudomonas palustris]WCL91480.1 STN domain-containing protein [Rhodopseudomonas palustris CGA009]WND52916.1 STN domain-containing protein [Rhodopseudomonas palustris]
MPASRLAAAFALVISVAVAAAEERNEQVGSIVFRIKAQPLPAALQAFSQQSGIQVMYETANASGFNAPALDGEFLPDAALRLLLADTDLKIRYSRARAVTLAPTGVADPDVPPVLSFASADMALETLHVTGRDALDRNRADDYVAAVQLDIQKALKRVNQSKRGEYRVAVRLWVDPSSRAIGRAELDGSTGDPARDASIADTLHGMTLSRQAPPDLPRPIRFIISVSTM